MGLEAGAQFKRRLCFIGRSNMPVLLLGMLWMQLVVSSTLYCMFLLPL